MNRCDSNEKASKFSFVKLGYATIIIHNVSTCLITLLYQREVNADKSLIETLQMGGNDFSQYCTDFDLLLDSVYPHKQFTEHLRCKENEHLLPLLAIVRKTKLLRALNEDLEIIISRNVMESRSEAEELKDQR